ncbi:hypothetical protein HD806DRAFT_506666 [Xylariaceae sp. AK1471]|nr:hypothetical protein HD806DRAFT_506666 [Xylariaceae sp. AK1471]
MNSFRIRSCNTATFKARTEELLDNELIAKVVYGFYAALSFGIFWAVMLTPEFVKGFFRVMVYILTPLLGDNTFWWAACNALLLVFLPFAHYCVGAYGPGLLRQLLYRTIVQPKLKRIYRENQEETERLRLAKDCSSFWLQLKEGSTRMLHGMKGILSFMLAKKGHIMLRPDPDEASDALSLRYVSSDGEEQRSSGDDRRVREEGPRTREQPHESRDTRERARRIGAKVGAWIGSKIGIAFRLPLMAAIRLGELPTELARKVQVMRLRRLQSERRRDLPGDIYLP